MILERGGRDVLTERIDISVSFAHVYMTWNSLVFLIDVATSNSARHIVGIVSNLIAAEWVTLTVNNFVKHHVLQICQMDNFVWIYFNPHSLW